MSTKHYQRQFANLTDKQLVVKKLAVFATYLDAQLLRDRDVMHDHKQQLHALTQIQRARGVDKHLQNSSYGVTLNLIPPPARKGLARSLTDQDADDEPY